MSPSLKRKPGRPRDEGLQSRRREEILDVAAILFAKRGYPNTDVDSVADKLGVGKGTIYRYFPTKSELFLAAVDRGMHGLTERVNQAVAAVADPIDRIVTAIGTYLEYFDEHPELVELFIQERAEFKDRAEPLYFQHHEASAEPWREMFRGLVAAGRVRDLDVVQTGDAINSMLYGAVIANAVRGRRGQSAAQARRIVDLLFHGILSPSERLRRQPESKFGKGK
jgi:AcrR family transcriptional regulator